MVVSPIIKQATLEEISTALLLLTRFFREEGFDSVLETLPTALAAMLQDAGSAVFLAWSGAEAFGVATVTTTSHGLEFARSAELEDLYVSPQARHQGVGRALIDHVKQWCRQNGCNILSVVVTPEAQAKHDLIAYYQKYGFQQSNRSTLFHHLAVY
jgi:GNAT superfamily N-acetyltransferase